MSAWEACAPVLILAVCFTIAWVTFYVLRWALRLLREELTLQAKERETMRKLRKAFPPIGDN